MELRIINTVEKVLRSPAGISSLVMAACWDLVALVDLHLFIAIAGVVVIHPPADVLYSSESEFSSSESSFYHCYSRRALSHAATTSSSVAALSCDSSSTIASGARKRTKTPTAFVTVYDP
jgi:hypothetical protein